MITEQEIDIAERFFETLDADASRVFFESFSEHQPNIFVYVMAMSENLKAEEAQYDSLYLTGVIFKAFETKYNIIKQISEHEVDETEQQIIALYQSLAAANDVDFETEPKNVLTESAQPILLSYVGNALTNGIEEYNEEDQGLAFNILQTVIECFNRSVDNNKMKIEK